MYGPSVDNHAIVFKETRHWIQFSLFGIFSHFPITKPTINDLRKIYYVYLLLPSSWNPNNPSYAENKESYLGWNSELVERRDDDNIYY